jgi:hypothetical protein
MPTCLSLQFDGLQGYFGKMQGEPIQTLAKTHCAAGSSSVSSLSEQQGGSARIAGRTQGIGESRSSAPTLTKHRPDLLHS